MGILDPPSLKIVESSTQPSNLAPNQIWYDPDDGAGYGPTDHDHDLAYEPMGRVVRHEVRTKGVHGLRDVRVLTTAPSLGLDVRGRAEPFPRWARTPLTVTNGVLYVAYLQPNISVAATKLFVETAGTASVGASLIKLALFGVDATGTITKVTDTGDVHASVLTAANALYEPTITIPSTLSGGYRWAVGLLAVGQSTPAVIWGSNVGASSQMNPPLCHSVSGQTDIASSYASGSLTASSSFMWIGAEN